VRWQPVDVLSTAFAGLLFVAGLARFQALEERGVLLRMCVVAVIPALIATLRGRNPNPSKPLQVLFDYYIILCVVVIFDGLGPLIRAVHPVDYDAALIAFDRALFDRLTSEFLDAVGTSIPHPVPRAEDVVLLKLDWHRAGGEVSERQWGDVLGVLKVAAGDLDRGYLSLWAKDLGLADLLERALEAAAV
jgi:hypothetical protein